jgi:CRISPR/Cas system-associated endoribonuclease Cas2
MLKDKQYLEMKSALDNLIKPEEDSIRFYLLCKNCAKNIVISGLGTYTEDENVIII